MNVLINVYRIFTMQMLILLLFILNNISALRFPEQGYDSNYYNNQAQYSKINAALDRLEHEPQWVSNWPDPFVKMGQVSGVTIDNNGLVFIFHRASNVWDATTFNTHNVYQAIGDPAIPHPTVLVFNDTGELVDLWGENLFFIPHGITVDSVGNVWLTDVALHQVFKFTPGQRQKPALVLGEKFVPGGDEQHFCKPSAVAVMSTGDFFVADGYCNTRIIKFASDGTRILQWGRRTGQSPFVFNVPHALALADDRGALCVADRERGRVACFRADNGSYVAGYSSWLIGQRLFSVAYSPDHGGRLYVVNGPHGGAPVRGYAIDFDSGRLTQTFAPGDNFHNPHDIAVSPDGKRLYVVELDPYRVCKFVDTRNNTYKPDKPAEELTKPEVQPSKPTATVEVVGLGAAGETGGWGAWSGALGGAAGAAGAALLALGALALLRARNRGRKCAARRRWEYGRGEFKLRRLLERRRFTRVHSDDSDDEPAPMLPPPQPHSSTNA